MPSAGLTQGSSGTGEEESEEKPQKKESLSVLGHQTRLRAFPRQLAGSSHSQAGSACNSAKCLMETSTGSQQLPNTWENSWGVDPSQNQARHHPGCVAIPAAASVKGYPMAAIHLLAQIFSLDDIHVMDQALAREEDEQVSYLATLTISVEQL